jgi:hypothetical protein
MASASKRVSFDQRAFESSIIASRQYEHITNGKDQLGIWAELPSRPKGVALIPSRNDLVSENRIQNKPYKARIYRMAHGRTGGN